MWFGQHLAQNLTEPAFPDSEPLWGRLVPAGLSTCTLLKGFCNSQFNKRYQLWEARRTKHLSTFHHVCQGGSWIFLGGSESCGAGFFYIFAEVSFKYIAVVFLEGNGCFALNKTSRFFSWKFVEDNYGGNPYSQFTGDLGPSKPLMGPPQAKLKIGRWVFNSLNHGNLRVPPLCHPPQEIRPY